MSTKLKAAKLATSAGADMVIANGADMGVIHRIVDGEPIDIKLIIDQDMVEIFVGEQVAFTYRKYAKAQYEVGLLSQDAKVEFYDISIRK